MSLFKRRSRPVDLKVNVQLADVDAAVQEMRALSAALRELTTTLDLSDKKETHE